MEASKERHDRCPDGVPAEAWNAFLERYLADGFPGRFTLLTFAVEERDYAMTNALLRRGEAVDKRDSKRRLSMLTAVRNDDLKMVRLLHKYGAALSGTMNPLWMSESAAMVDCLVELGAEASEAGNEGWSPLHNAVFADKCEEVIGALVRHGANVNSGLEFDNTPIQEAIANHASGEAVACLMDHGASIPYPPQYAWVMIEWLKTTEPRRDDLIEKVKTYIMEASK